MSSFTLFQLIIILILIIKLNNGLTTPQTTKTSIISTKLSTSAPKTTSKTTSSSQTSTRKTSTLTTTTRTSSTTTTKKTSTSTSSSKNNILVTTDSSSILVFDLNKGVLVKSILVAEQQAYLLLYASQYVIGSTSKGKISVWDLATSKVTCVFSNTYYVQDLILIDGDRFASSNYFDYSVWNFKTCSLIYKNVIGSLIFSIVYLGNGLLASYSDDGLIRVLDLSTLKLKANFLAQIWGDSLYFSDKYLSLLGWDTIYLWNINSFSLYKAITYSDLSAVNSKLFTYNNFILTNQINDVFVFSITDGSLLYKLDVKIGGHTKQISDVVLFKNNGLLATAGEDNLIKVWDLNKVALKYTFNLAGGIV